MIEEELERQRALEADLSLQGRPWSWPTRSLFRALGRIRLSSRPLSTTGSEDFDQGNRRTVHEAKVSPDLEMT